MRETENQDKKGPTRPSEGFSKTVTERPTESNSIKIPQISLPKGGGAIRGIGEKFAANPVTGTGSMSVPIATSPGRSGFGPQLNLTYDSGSGNGPFGFGWTLSIPQISRKTDKGLPQYDDKVESDVFMLSGSEDLVPLLNDYGSRYKDTTTAPPYTIHRYRPRIEGLFARIERWTNSEGDFHWRSISRDNMLTIYGRDHNSRIADPSDPTRIFTWLIAETRDNKGNAILYEYKEEDGAGVDFTQAHERNRGDRNAPNRTSNRYLKSIKYGNLLPLLNDSGKRPRFLTDDQIKNTNWMFEVVFDYGEHHVDTPNPNDGNAWTFRKDPFSFYRGRFEVRTCRICQRVLMFHHFESEEGVGKNCLVRSTDFSYSHQRDQNDKSNPIYTFLLAVTQYGYKRDNGGYLKRSLPSVEFEYSKPIVQDTVEEVDTESLENLPIGLDGTAYQWIDLHGEGIPGILTEQGEAWFYKRNLSPISDLKIEFAPLERVAVKPNLPLAAGAQLMDLAGDGQLDLVVLAGAIYGLYEHDGYEGWQPFRPFTSHLNRDTQNPNLKFIDLDGDGHADILITEDEAFVWHASLAEEGFGEARRVYQALDEEKGPRLVFSDGTQSIYLADLSGDGLTDLARIRNGEFCYWPNLGYGRFGAKVTMDNAPLFDNPDQFDHRRIRLADIDGTGTNDIIYLHRTGVRLYFNQSGNSWSEGQILQVFPRVDDLVSMLPVDLLGNGTACLVWSSPLPGDSGRHMRYVNLMGSQKPHLLTTTRNNLGAETRIQYASSTKYYIKDKSLGKSWITKLPFPVHVVVKVTVTDKWRKTKFCSTYSYHHGYYDGVEREFRGFGRVEQVDVESYGEFEQGNVSSPYITEEKALYQPPVKTITWYHTGALLDRERVLTHYKQEYFPEWLKERHPGKVKIQGDFGENVLPQHDLAAEDLTSEEWREALRSCKGMMLRQEIVELDVDALEKGEHRETKLFSTAYNNCHIRRLQPGRANRHAVFLVTESEAITYHYELDIRENQLSTLTPDPRIAHTLNLQYDEYGHVLQSVAIAYPRRGKYKDAFLAKDELQKIHDVQLERHLAYSETRYTEDFGHTAADKVDALDNYRLRVPCAVMSYELTGINPKQQYFTLDELKEYQLSQVHQKTGKHVADIAYHIIPSRKTPAKRLVEHARTLFFNENLIDLLPFGELGRLGLTFETYKLALTDTQLNAIFKDSTGKNKLEDLVDGVKSARDILQDASVSGYLSGTNLAKHFAPTPAESLKGQYWIRSGIAGFAPDAAQHFYLPERYTDPFENVTTLEYDSHDLYLVSSTDPRQNKTEVTRFDFRILAPREIKDINENLTEVYFDLLGLPSAMAVKGKGTEGDNFTGFNDKLANPALDKLTVFFAEEKPYDEEQARKWLGNATARYVYYFGEVEETLPSGETITRWGQHPACACGILRERHVSQLATGEKSAMQVGFEYSDGKGNVVVKKAQAEPEKPGQPLRWIANGKTILNNKGKPVKLYEPYFSVDDLGQPNHCYEEPREEGVTPIIYYDAVGRTIRTEMPDGSYSRLEFSPWYVRTFDQNDTVNEPGNAWFEHNSTGTKEEQRAAQLATEHADTPKLAVLDTLGRDVISIAHNRVKGKAETLKDEKYFTYTKLDAEGKPLWIRDARRNLVMQYITPVKPTRAADEPDANITESIPEGAVPCYDIAGNLLFQHSMDAGDRWMFNNAAGKPMLAWDYNERQDEEGKTHKEHRVFFTQHDTLLRPVMHWLTINGGTPQLFERFEYIDTQDKITDAPTRNLRGQLHKHFDSGGLKQVERFDFKVNPLELRRQLAQAIKAPVIDWQSGSKTAVLEIETFAQITEYDALNRMIRLYNWHHIMPNSRVAVYEPQYSQRGLLAIETIILRATKKATGYSEGPQAERTVAIRNIEYDAKGQKQRIQYGNGTTTRYHYDPSTFRLQQLRTTRPGFDKTLPQKPSTLKDDQVLQNLYYTYDPVGNITEIHDDAYEPIFFQNQEVKPISLYTYDALYRLVQASGRENGAAVGPPPQIAEESKQVAFPVTSPNALRNYSQYYVYDAVGNIEQMQHSAGTGSWTRNYTLATDSNRLLNTTQGNDVSKSTTDYLYDTHGNMLNIANVAPGQFLRWDYIDMIHILDLKGGGLAYFNYDATKQRTRKRLERLDGSVEERIDLGGLELFRRFVGGVLLKEIESIHIIIDQQRVLLVDDVLKTDNTNLKTGLLYRYQYGNHLGSVALEIDEQTKVISYEEYHPYGSTAYAATRNLTETKKRYRYTGKERDEESGFFYHGARYYAPWLTRWTSSDPAGMVDGTNLFTYSRNNPLVFNDPRGLYSEPRLRMTDEPPRPRFELKVDPNLAGPKRVHSESEAEPRLHSSEEPSKPRFELKFDPNLAKPFHGKILGVAGVSSAGITLLHAAPDREQLGEWNCIQFKVGGNLGPSVYSFIPFTAPEQQKPGQGTFSYSPIPSIGSMLGLPKLRLGMAYPKTGPAPIIDEVGEAIKEQYLKPQKPPEPPINPSDEKFKEYLQDKVKGEFGKGITNIIPLPKQWRFLIDKATEPGHTTKAQEEFDLKKYIDEENTPYENRWSGPISTTIEPGKTVKSADGRPLWTAKPAPPPPPNMTIIPKAKYFGF